MATITPVKTPIGELRWINISGEGKKPLDPKNKNSYTVTLALPTDSPKCVELQNIINDFWAENKPKGANKPKSTGFKEEVDRETDKPTGMTEFTFRTDTTFKDNKPKTIQVFDARANDITSAMTETRFANGSRGLVHGAMSIYDRPEGKGVSLYLNAVQFTKVIEYTGGVSADAVEDEEGEDYTYSNGVATPVNTHEVEV